MTTSPISILHLEDSELDAAMVKRRLDRSSLAYTLDRATDRATFVALLASKTFDLILSDYQVPTFDGLEALSIAREKQPDTPLIFVSGAMGEDLAVEALKLGATDYVLKDRLTRLPAAIERALVESRERLQRRQAEAEVRSSLERFRQLADTMPQMVWVTRPDGFHEYYNKRWYDFTGVPQGSTDGEGWNGLFHPEDQPRAWERWRRSLATGEPYEIEYRLRHHSGEYRWTLGRALPIRAVDGLIERWFGTCTDIHDQKLQEEELRLHREHLQRLVDERTLALEATHRQLRLSERMAALGTLSAGLGHDMGNLLMPIRVRLESLSRADLPAPLRNDVEAISTSAEYLRKLSVGLRQLAIDPSNTRGPRVTDLRSWMEETFPMLRNSLPVGITLEFKMPETPYVARISRAALTQAVFNLVQNAGDAMRDRGHGKVLLWLEDSTETVTVFVKDDGPGMSPEVKARCMEPYFTTKTRGISTGMGLSLVYGLLNESGGSIKVESAVGVGSTFMITLPRAASADDASPQLSPKTAVIEVNDARMRAVITSELRSLGFNIQTRSALPPNVFVLDDAQAISRGHESASVILLADSPTDVNGHSVTALGPRPAASVLLQALRTASRAKGIS